MNRYISCLMIFFSCMTLVKAQDIIIMDGFTTDFSSCDAVLYDPGFTDNYSDNQFVEVTICSDNMSDLLEIDFTEFDLEFGSDFLTIYDGDDISFPEVAGSPFTGNTLPGTITSSGSCLTFEFFSDFSVVGSGWEAALTCVSATECLEQAVVTLDPVPVAGECFADTTYTVCLDVQAWDLAAPNAFHGFTIDLGPAWDATSITPISAPSSCDGLGLWTYFSSVTSTGTGETFGPGYFYDADIDGNAGNNAGDVCGVPFNWQFCFEVTMENCATVSVDDNASISIDTHSDGESGMFNDPACASDDEIELTYSAICGPCLNPPTVTMTGIAACPPASPSLQFDMTGNPPFTISYTIDGIPASLNTMNFTEVISINYDAEYELVSISDASCQDEPATGIVMIPTPIISTISLPSDTGFCTGGSIDIIVELEGTPPFDFSWTVDGNPGGTASTSDNTYVITTSTPGDYTIDSFTSGGCTQDPPFPTVNIVQSVPPNANMTSVNDTICPGETSNLTFFVFGAPPFNLTIAQDGVDIETVSVPTPGPFSYTVSEGGIYTVSQITNQGCTGNANGQTEIVELELPTITVSGGGEICDGSTTEVIFDCTGIGPWQIDYLIGGTPQTPITANTSPFTLETGTVGNYTISGGADAYCNAVIDGVATVSFGDPIEAEFQEDIVFCEGQSGELIVQFSADASSYDFTYSIDGDDQGTITATENPFSLPVSVPGEYELLTLITDGVCEGEVEGSVDVSTTPPPTADLLGDITFCEGGSGIFDLTLTGVSPWVLSYQLDGIDQDNDTIYFDTGEFMVDEGGTYTLVAISDDLCTGLATGQATAVEVPSPSASIIAPDSVCAGTEYSLLVVLEGDPEFNFDLQLDGLPYESYTVDNDSLYILTEQSGEYAISAISDQTCNAVDVDTVEVMDFPAPTITTTMDSTTCVLDTITLGGLATGGFGGPFSYAWVVGTDTIPNDTIDVVVTGTNAYELIVNDGCDIPYSAFSTITAHPYPYFLTEDLNIGRCGEGEITLDSEIPLSLYGDSCLWTVNGIEYNVCDSIHIPLTQAGGYDVSIYVETIDGCVLDTTFDELIFVNNIPAPDFTYTPTTPTITEDFISFQNLTVFGDSYTWFLDSLIFSDEFSPSIDLPDSETEQSYTVCLAVSNEFGCADTTCKEITVEGDLIVHVPTAFTPDNDMVNDTWAPVILGAITDEYNLKIFGRSGQLIWESTDMNERWLGQGADDQNYYAGDSMYHWQLEVRRLGSVDKRTYRGIVTLVR